MISYPIWKIINEQEEEQGAQETRTSFYWKEHNTALHGIFPTSDHYHMTTGYASWDCGPWEKEGSELTSLSYLIDEGILIHSLVTFFKKTGDISTRGHTWKLAKKHSRCDLYFFFRRVINWNNLSQEDMLTFSP